MPQNETDDENSIIVHSGKLKLASVLAETVASNDKQNIIMLIEAKPGKGKSYAALDLATWTACELSRILGKTPDYYFNMDHVAIINANETVRIIENHMHQHGIYIFDDFGVGYSAREWQSDSNKAMNNMLQTIRTDNNILIITVPDSDWIDKIGRNILHFKVVMEQPMFKLGLTMGKLTIEEKNYNSNSKNTYHKYFKTKNEVYNNVVFGKPPEAICKVYDAERDRQLQLLKSQSLEDYKKAKSDSGNLPKNQKAETLMRQVEMFIDSKNDGMSYPKINSLLKTTFGELSYTAKHLAEYARTNGMYE